MEERELRFVENSPAGMETRADGKEYFTGRAIVFNAWSNPIGGWFREMIHPSALDETNMSDVVIKYNHDINFTLGRTTSGTLTLEKRSDGLYYSTPFDPEDPDHVKVRAKIRRGDVTSSSFEFTVKAGTSQWERDEESGYELRTVMAISRLYDVAPVVFPAYSEATSSMAKRDFESMKAERDILLQERAQSESIISNTADSASEAVEAELDMLAMQLEL